MSTYLHTHSQQSKLLSFLPHFACFFIISGFLPIQNATELTVHYRPISLCLVSTLVRTRATCFHSFICPPFSLILYLLSSRDERQSVGPGCKKGEQRAGQGRGETMPGYSIITWHPSPSPLSSSALYFVAATLAAGCENEFYCSSVKIVSHSHFIELRFQMLEFNFGYIRVSFKCRIGLLWLYDKL